MDPSGSLLLQWKPDSYRQFSSFVPHISGLVLCADVSLYFLEATIPRQALLTVGIGTFFLWMGIPVGYWIPVGTDDHCTLQRYTDSTYSSR